MKTAGSELREMARAILAELDGASWQPEEGLPEENRTPGDSLDEQDMKDMIYRLRGYRALRTGEHGNETATQAWTSAPRTTRRQFLSQRLERRAERDAENSVENSGETENFTVAEVRRDELTDAGTPARLSEIYRRDARRYDGPFERY